MLDEIDRAYFRRRIREEQARAEASADDCSAMVHRNLANEYERRLAVLKPLKPTN